MKTVDVPLKDLHPDPANARKHSEENLSQIMASLQRFGQHRAAVVQRDTGIVLIGNGMLEAAKRLGWKTLSVYYVDDDNATAAMRAIADNRTGESSTWDEDALAALLREQDEDFLADFDLADFIPDPDPGEVLDPEAPPVPVDPVTRPGDVIRLGGHVVICGDSLDPAVVAQVVPEGGADACFTDPPYNVDYGNHGNQKGGNHKAIANDSMPADQWAGWCASVARGIEANVKGCVYVCHAPGPDGRVMAQTLDTALHWSATVIWAKDRFTLGRGKYQRRYEPIWFGWGGDGKGFTEARDREDVWDMKRPSVSKEHPTMKPVALCAQAITDSTRKGNTVYDPFLGSGSTLLACEQLGRRCVGIELDPGYCDVIITRWEGLTGEKAERPLRRDSAKAKTVAAMKAAA